MRGCLALLLALVLCCGHMAAADARYVVSTGGAAALVDADGREVLSGAGVQALFEVRPGTLYAAGEIGDYALYDADGRQLGVTRFQMIDDMGGALVFRQDGRYGAMDAAGAVIVSPVWTQLAGGGAGFLALDGNPLDEQPDEVLAVAADGSVAATGVYTDSGLRPFREGRMAFRAADGRYGYLDADGREVIPAEWAWAGDFGDGVAAVSDGKLYGLIAPDGARRVSPKYVWLRRGEGFIAGLRADGVLELRSADGAKVRGEILAPSGDVALVGRYAAVMSDDAATLYDADGAAVLTAAPGALFLPGLDGQVIVADGAWGEACQWLANPDGAPASGRCQRLLPLCAGRYAFMTFGEDFSDVRCGLLDANGVERAPARYQEIVPCGGDRLILIDEDTVRFADPDGNALRTWPRNE